MSRLSIGLACVGAASLLAIGCGGDPGPTDAGSDSGPPNYCALPDGGVSGEQPCCYSQSQAGSLDAPELRLRYIDILAPEGSPLMSPLLLGVLNDALAMNTFAWLIRVEGADADGPVNVVTGFGLTNDDGTYTFPTGTTADPLDLPRYAPVMIAGTLTGEVVTTERFDGSLTVPVLNTEGTAVQLELVLRNIRVTRGELSAERSCVGAAGPRGRYTTAAELDGFIEVESARTGMVVSGPVMTTVCAAIAGGLTDPEYCDQPQSAWETQPDSLCDAAGCTRNTEGMEDLCDTAGDSTTGLPACNAWRLVAEFAAHGVQITD